MPPERTQRNCEMCIDKGKARAMKTYRRRRDAGLCGKCGDSIEGERVGRSVCRACSASNSEYERARSSVRVAQRRKRRRIKRARTALLKMRSGA